MNLKTEAEYYLHHEKTRETALLVIQKLFGPVFVPPSTRIIKNNPNKGYPQRYIYDTIKTEPCQEIFEYFLHLLGLFPNKYLFL